jgi:glutamine amidotransferase
MRTVLIDYDSGNLHSAEKAFQRMALERDAGEVIVSDRAEDVASADRIVLPGDGAFPACRSQLFERSDLFEALNEAVTQKGRPFMGICVGMQLMANRGFEYEEVDGFGWINGDVKRIAPTDPNLKIPHMGWNELIIDAPHPVLDGVTNGDHAYFVHSYQMEIHSMGERLAHVEYGGDVTAVVGTQNRIGVQFHPEKSQSAGLRMIGNFLTWAP